MNAVVDLFPRWFATLTFGLILFTGACASRNTSTDATSSSAAQPASDQPGGMRSSSEWPAYNGGYNATRFSPVTQINTGNVASLVEVARFKLPETTAFQSGPVLIDGTMYVTTATNTYAIDARTAQLRWSHHFEPKSMGLGTPVRGVGYADGRLFRGTPDGHLLAMGAKTGKGIWDVVGADATRGEYYTVAPIVWEGRVYIANSGSDVGATGHIRAFDVQSGKQIWNFDIVPSTGPAAETWAKDKPKLGGGVYSSFALDTETGVLYAPTGNPGPDFVASYRPGDNLYTCSVVMLDARTGALRGYHQLVKNDFHDWDLAASPILFTSKAGKKMVAAAGKNGYLYGLDRELKTVLYKVAVTRIENTETPLTPEGTRFLPGTQGGTNWYGPSYSPLVNAIYVPTIDWATTIKLGGPQNLTLKPGTPFLGSSNGFGDQDPISQRLGHVTAVDADSGKVLWKYDADTSMVASVTPTAGGLVLTGDTKGNFIAFDAKDGKVLLKKHLGDPIGGGIVIYEIGGVPYVAVAGGMKNTVTQQTDSGPAWVAILALPK
ncbi:MAG: PQQ-binding-like beta-propeller repeat protein [Bryobacteraceae bacterium]